MVSFFLFFFFIYFDLLIIFILVSWLLFKSLFNKQTQNFTTPVLSKKTIIQNNNAYQYERQRKMINLRLCAFSEDSYQPMRARSHQIHRWPFNRLAEIHPFFGNTDMRRLIWVFAERTYPMIYVHYLLLWWWWLVPFIYYFFQIWKVIWTRLVQT